MEQHIVLGWVSLLLGVAYGFELVSALLKVHDNWKVLTLVARLGDQVDWFVRVLVFRARKCVHRVVQIINYNRKANVYWPISVFRGRRMFKGWACLVTMLEYGLQGVWAISRLITSRMTLTWESRSYPLRASNRSIFEPLWSGMRCTTQLSEFQILKKQRNHPNQQQRVLQRYNSPNTWLRLSFQIENLGRQ